MTIELRNGYIVAVAHDEMGYALNPRDDDNTAHIYGEHRRYTIADGTPPAEHRDALARGGIRLLARYLTLAGDALAVVKVGMIDHSGVSYYPVEMGRDAGHPLDPGGYDSGAVGYAYVTRADMTGAGFTPEESTPERARDIIAGEIAAYSSWANGEVYEVTVSRPCPHDHGADALERIAGCPHTETVESIGGFIGDPDDALTEGRGIADFLPAAAVTR